MLISSNPLASGFLVRHLDPNSTETQIAVRATLANRKSDCVDLLLVTIAGGYVRVCLITFEFKVSSSFKTKCLHEDVGDNKALVGIDVFDSKEPSIRNAAFEVKAVALLSETHSLSLQPLQLPSALQHLLHSQKLFYFLVDVGVVPSATALSRSQHRVCFRDASLVRLSSDGSSFFDFISKPNFLGFLEQESKTIKHEFGSIMTKIRQKFECDVALGCHEFLDFEVIWLYRNVGMVGRETRVFSPENDSQMVGIHSILSTPINMHSFRAKKLKPLSAPSFSVVIDSPRRVEHDFNHNRLAQQILQNKHQIDCEVPLLTRRGIRCVFEVIEQWVGLEGEWRGGTVGCV